MSTLAERKDQLGALIAELARHKEDHKLTLGLKCGHVKTGCAERVSLEAEIKSARLDIKTWFAPQPSDATLFDGEG